MYLMESLITLSGTCMPLSFAPRRAMTCMMVTEMSAPVGDGS